MIKYLLIKLRCRLGIHGVKEYEYTIDDDEFTICRDCLKEIK